MAAETPTDCHEVIKLLRSCVGTLEDVWDSRSAKHIPGYAKNDCWPEAQEARRFLQDATALCAECDRDFLLPSYEEPDYLCPSCRTEGQSSHDQA